MDPRRRAGGILWRAMVLALAVVLGMAAAFAFALGTCHDAGGFCEADYSVENQGAYAVAVALAAAAAPLAAVAFTRRREVLFTAALVTSAFFAMSAVAVEAVR